MNVYCAGSSGGHTSGDGPLGKKNGNLDREDSEEGRGSDEVEEEVRPGTKPHLHVYIPGQKEFVPTTVSLPNIGSLLYFL